MTDGRSRNVVRVTLGTAVFLVAIAVAVVGFLRGFAPRRYQAPMPPFLGYDPAPMAQALSTNSVRAQWEAILAFGSRGQGQEGFLKTRDHIRKRFEAAGLNVLEYSQPVAVPRTLQRDIRGADGQPLADVEIFPFMPNHFQPAVTLPEGITGRLLLVSNEVLHAKSTFEDCIALIDAVNPPEAYGLDWIKYAQLGFRAVIVAHTNGLESVEWKQGNTVVCSSVPVCYVRVAATKGIFRHVDETVTLQVRQVWAETEDTAIVGVLPSASARPADEAVLITACSDASSILPDRAPGTLGALNVAAQLALLEGMTAYRDAELKRDVVFVSYGSQAMGLMTPDRLSSLLGTAMQPEEGGVFLEDRRKANDTAAANVREAAACFDQPGFLADKARTEAALAALSLGGAAALDEELRYVLNTIVLETSEDQLRAKLVFMGTDESDLSTPEFAAYRKAKRRYDDVMAVAGYPVPKLAESCREFLQNHDVVARCRERLRELGAFHDARRRQLEQGVAIRQALGGYRRLIPFGAMLMPAEPDKTRGETLGFFMGRDVEPFGYVQYPAIHDVVQSVIQSMDFPADVRCEALRVKDHGSGVAQAIANVPVDSRIWGLKGYPSFVLVHTDRTYAYAQLGSPVEKLFMRNLDTMASSLQVYGRCALALAFGDGRFEAPQKSNLGYYGGRVFVANVGKSIIPNYPLAHALLGHKGATGSYEQPGFYVSPFIFTDVYGRYDLPLLAASFVPWTPNGYSPEAVGFGPDGRIRFMKDEGAQGQNVYRSLNLPWYGSRDAVNIVVFRAEPVTLLDLINPQSLKAYSGCGYLSRDGLSPMPKHNVWSLANGITTAFLEPDRRFFVTLKAGTPDNDMVQTTRAFLLGVDGAFIPSRDREIDGRGYLAPSDPFILDVPRETAQSMLMVNGRRLDLQQQYHMADERTLAFHRRSRDLLENSLKPDQSKYAAILAQRDAVTYTTLNHPVLRRSIFEAVVGILWYLGLLVPFVFFFEKLVFGFADIRKQLAAQAAIFLVVFALLRWLHPAFEMIRSSGMILLGFVIMLISGGITVLFAGKFQENLEDLKKRRGQVTAAEINTMGVTATAFALGLNNMHRRIVRTGLTCATLVLITFAMICFTSVQSDLVNVTQAIGKAAYQGLLVKAEKMAPMSDSELFALQTKYGHKFQVARRHLTVGRQGWDRVNSNPDLLLSYEPPDQTPKQSAVAGMMQFDAEEPLRDRLQLVAGSWFTKEEVKASVEQLPILIPDVMAASLGITPERLAETNVIVKVNGRPYHVHGIFAAESLAQLRDLDGRDLLPFDIEAMRTVEMVSGRVLAQDTDPRMSAEKLVIAPVGEMVNVGRGEWRLASVAIAMPGLGYREARAEVDRYLEQSGAATYYGLDEVSYRGRRAREKSFGGMLELMIPLVIAAITVLNTMRGSVYERKDEIFVYNAVGIAPRYIFAMFFSEAFVYAVVGSVLGYLLSQGTGRALTALGWTGGLNMTFTSINTIYASLAIMAAVFISTLFPARQAMQIAMPAEDTGWKLPAPEGDRMTFALPFTFDRQGRIAVLAFFHRYFSDHGEGSSGKFFAGPPAVGLSESADALAGGACIPELRVTIWLKPFDLGVSQQLTIALPTDPETHEFIARIELARLSGSRESWLRLNTPFVALVRRQFLDWKAVSVTEREALFAESRHLLEEAVTDRGRSHG